MSEFQKNLKVKIDYIVQNTSNIHAAPLKLVPPCPSGRLF